MTPTYKTTFLESTLKSFPANAPLKMLELGCGRAEYVPELLEAFPNVSYVGVEQNNISLSSARKNLQEYVANGRACLIYEYGEHALRDAERSFDLVYSLSVLEHVKRTREFIMHSVNLCKIGGIVAHRYDLGHALFPSSLGEALKVRISTLCPYFMPASSFTYKPSLAKMTEWLELAGAAVEVVQHTQMPSIKACVNVLSRGGKMTADLMRRITELERELALRCIGLMPERSFDRSFATKVLIARRLR